MINFLTSRPFKSVPLALATVFALSLAAGNSHAQSVNDASTSAAKQSGNDRNVVLITTDGLRWEELFRGANPKMYTEVNQVTTPSLLEKKYGTENDENRREKLMPFIWSTVVKHGEIFGNRDVGSKARVTNDKWFSYPGYNELFTGYPDNTIASNRKIPNKNVTVFEWLNNQPDLNGKVVAFGAWDAFPAIINSTRAKLKVDAGHGDPYPRLKDYLKDHKPRVMFLGFGPTDGWAHKGNYKEYLGAAHDVDASLADLWKTLQADPQYKDNTTFIFTSDHGRGNSKHSPKAWNSHGKSTPDSDSLYIAIWGPDTPANGVVKGGEEVTQSQVAATLAQALGYDYNAAQPKAAEPIDGALAGK